MYQNGLGMSLGNLSRLSNAVTRSISPENRTGEKGKGGMAPASDCAAARDLGQGWKCHAYDILEPGEVYEIADIKASGAIQSFWITGQLDRFTILRFYWDDCPQPSVECPLADFFGLPWFQTYAAGKPENFPRLNSMPVCVNPRNGFNCFWEMPFRKRAHITLENRHPTEKRYVYFQLNYTETEVPEDAAYFHAQFRRVNPLPYKEVFTILDGIEGEGHYVGTVMGYGCTNNSWWGEGEIKFYMDGDTEFPTICGTGTEDYFGGSYNWDFGKGYEIYSTPFMGHHQFIPGDGWYSCVQRHGMYRWHIMDPIRFKKDLRVTMQALGWRNGGRYLPGTPDICSTAFWYQKNLGQKFPQLPDNDRLEII